MRFFQKRLMFMTLCGLICITGLFYQASYNPAKPASGYPAAGQAEAAADLKLEGMDEQTYELSSFMDKPLLVTFFASWCGICSRELPQLSAYQEKHKENWNMAAINVTKEEINLEGVRSFARGLTVPVLLDRKGEAMDHFGVRGVPASFLLNERGAVIKRFYGPIEKDELEKALSDVQAGA
ncbi:TlpA family protein disulfide reductase [Salibacterium qingdaonense]|uniref:Thiol-disulfide isomerase or thioredoxin n=1 Tax=Salibacterium qingdaonense TaxID=266892 RepID=A0A1I4IIV8_9BACI|nr:TlpA disulfide reductase family protein [Salibacterium qingdaonense]SFL54027.1 Thiol-disulfide isomerase or thioredoxin [Salibacterium qingdaonense]